MSVRIAVKEARDSLTRSEKNWMVTRPTTISPTIEQLLLSLRDCWSAQEAGKCEINRCPRS